MVGTNARKETYSMKIYAEERLDNLLTSKRRELKERIESETEDYILNVGEEQYVEYLKSEFTLDIPEIHTDKVYADTYEGEIHASRFPREFLKNDIDSYNSSLEGFIRSTLISRRQQIEQKSDFLSSLGVPIKKKENTSQTFAVPQPKLKQKIQVRPVVHSKGFKPEPTLDNDNYFKILKIINDVGKNFERLPSVYSGKYEEHLRDHILLTLDPNFEFGSASGETFNKTGKTNIQLRHDSSVVFVAECKFWTGEKGFLATIDQLLSYLTWRDSKTSVVIFVNNKSFSSVLDTAKEAIKNHPNYIREKTASDDNWTNYRFSLPGDSNKEIQMALQMFHLP